MGMGFFIHEVNLNTNVLAKCRFGFDLEIRRLSRFDFSLVIFLGLDYLKGLTLDF